MITDETLEQLAAFCASADMGDWKIFKAFPHYIYSRHESSGGSGYRTIGTCIDYDNGVFMVAASPQVTGEIVAELLQARKEITCLHKEIDEAMGLLCPPGLEIDENMGFIDFINFLGLPRMIRLKYEEYKKELDSLEIIDARK